MELLAEQSVSNVCSSALLAGFWGERAVVGESIIAQATDPFPDIGSAQNLAIGADAIKIRDELTRKVLGEIFVRHYVHHDIAANFFSEELVMVAGTGVFRGGKATIRLHGDLFTGADMSGTVCTAR